jgi:hypothetical protein
MEDCSKLSALEYFINWRKENTMRFIASGKVLQLSSALALSIVLSVSLNPARAGSESGGVFASGGASEGGGIFSVGEPSEGGGIYNNRARTEDGGIYNNGSRLEGGGVFNSDRENEGGGVFNSGGYAESGLGHVINYPPNPYAWSTYEGPKAPPPWGAPTMSGSGGMASAGSEQEAIPQASAVQANTPLVVEPDIAADAKTYVHYYGP